MVIGLWMAVGVLAAAAAVLLVKLLLLQRSADELREAFARRLTTQTNTLIDISSRDRHMQALAADINVQLRLLRAERQRFTQGDAELKEAVASISHDLRTPLTAISGYLQLLEREDCGETTRRYLGIITNRTEALKRLTEELFRYSVLTTQAENEPAPVVINDVLEESLAAAYGALTQRGITPNVILPYGKVERLLDRSALSRVFENILQNAVKYSDGDLCVELSCDGTVTFSNAASGLDAVSSGRLFDRFYTLENARNSTGLGLSIAKQLMERMGGGIFAEWRQGRLFIVLRFAPPDSAA